MSYITGLLEGFRGRGEEVYQQAVKDDADRRVAEGRLFQYLLASRDPQIRSVALSGMYESAQASPRKKGFRGFLGEIEQSSQFPQIQQIANELVPVEEPPTPAPANTPDSAAMSTNAPVEPGSAPIPPTLDFTPPPEYAGTQDFTGAPPAPEMPAQAAAGPGAPPMAPQAPPVSKFKRRGTQVPTAEEIAEYQARIPLQTRIGMAEQYLNEDDARRAIMGILGAPQTTRQFAAPTFAVEDPTTGNPVPVSFDFTTGQFAFTDGTPVPRGAKFVRMATGGTTGGLTSTIRDSPDVRAQYGIDPADRTPSGYWKIKQLPDGSSMVMPSEYTPPPAYSGTTTIYDPRGVPVVAPVQRGGGVGAPLGPAVNEGPTKVQTDAQGLLAAVDKMITAAGTGEGGLRRQVSNAQMDQVVKTEAGKLGLPYQTYAELQLAAKSRAEFTPSARQEPTTGMSMADRVRARALQNRGAGVRPTPQAAPPPPAPSVRSQGPGPRR